MYHSRDIDLESIFSEGFYDVLPRPITTERFTFAALPE